jgi:Tfp pilus assembly protein PilF
VKEDAAGEHIIRAKEALDTKRFSDARKEAQLALKSKKDSPEANLLLAFAYKQLSKPKDSLKYAREAVKYRLNIQKRIICSQPSSTTGTSWDRRVKS